MSLQLQHALTMALLAVIEFLTWQRIAYLQRAVDRARDGTPMAVDRRHGDRRASGADGTADDPRRSAG